VDSRFFELWLDAAMVYSCAYFPDPAASLEVAQQQKLEHICRKLRLTEGETLLDIGCGWGGLVIHAAKKYGVHALGVTNSERQFEYARARIQDENLSGICDVQLCDYRQINGTYDKISSIGMFEHVGKPALSAYFSQIGRLLRPGGAFLNHGIAVGSTVPQRPKPMTGIGSRWFPDGELIPIADVLQTAIGSGLELRDVENLREHYALTLEHWLHRLETRRNDVLTIVDEATYRTWRLLLVASAQGFRRNTLAVYQSLFVHSAPGFTTLPLTRSDWYLPVSSTRVV
jgi:cyclopropane-fatty-acyl-phospholipid synthase